MAKFLAIAALIVSSAALALAAFVYAQMDAVAEQAVERREQQLVEQLQPQVHSLYRDFGLELPPAAQQPQSLADLLQPLLQIRQELPREE